MDVRLLFYVLLSTLLVSFSISIEGQNPTLTECRPHIEATIRDLAAQAIGADGQQKESESPCPPPNLSYQEPTPTAPESLPLSEPSIVEDFGTHYDPVPEEILATPSELPPEEPRPVPQAYQPPVQHQPPQQQPYAAASHQPDYPTQQQVYQYPSKPQVGIIEGLINSIFGLTPTARDPKYAKPWNTHPEFQKKPKSPVDAAIKAGPGVISSMINKYIGAIFNLPSVVERDPKWAQPWQAHKEHAKVRSTEKVPTAPKTSYFKFTLVNSFIESVFGKWPSERDPKYAQPWSTHPEFKKALKGVTKENVKVDDRPGVISSFINKLISSGFGLPDVGKRDPKWSQPWQTHSEFSRKASKAADSKLPKEDVTSPGFIRRFVHKLVCLVFKEPEGERDPKWAQPWNTHKEHARAHKSVPVDGPAKPKEGGIFGFTFVNNIVELVFGKTTGERDPKWAEPWQSHFGRKTHEPQFQQHNPPSYKPYEAPEQKPYEAPAERPYQAPAQKPYEAPSQKPYEAHAQKPYEAPAQKPYEAPVPKPTEAPAPKPVEVPAPKTVKVPAPKPVEVPAPKPVEVPAQKPAPSLAKTEPIFPSDTKAVRKTKIVAKEVKNVGPTKTEAFERSKSSILKNTKKEKTLTEKITDLNKKRQIPQNEEAKTLKDSKSVDVKKSQEVHQDKQNDAKIKMKSSVAEDQQSGHSEVKKENKNKFQKHKKEAKLGEKDFIDHSTFKSTKSTPKITKSFKQNTNIHSETKPKQTKKDKPRVEEPPAYTADRMANAPKAPVKQVLEEVERETPQRTEKIVEDEEQIVVIPSTFRPRDHIDSILGLDDASTHASARTDPISDATLRDLKKIYETSVKPLEASYNYLDISNRHLSDAELFGTPLVLLLGPYSTGKSTFINYLLGIEFTKRALKTGTPPSHGVFRIVQHGEYDRDLDGTDLSGHWSFGSLQKFGQNFVDQIKGKALNIPLLKKVTFVEAPGILEMRRPGERLYPFNDVVQWFIDRADLILVMFDYTKLDAGYELEAILDQLKGREAQTRILLNKADQVPPEELIKVQGSLFWNLSPLLGINSPPIVYAGSFASLPLRPGSPVKLFQAQEETLLHDVAKAINSRVDNRVAIARRHAVRVRNHAQMVDTYLTTFYKNKGFLTSNHKLAEDIVENPHSYHIYEGMSLLTNISRYDLPDAEVYRDFFRIHNLYEFRGLRESCSYIGGCPLDKIDSAISKQLPELLTRHRRLLDAASPSSRFPNPAMRPSGMGAGAAQAQANKL